MNYKETLDFLYSLQKFGIKFGLSSTENLLARLGRPDQSLASLHLAGTNGKGSVGATVTAVLTEAGYRVGFYSSPHLISFRERFIIGRETISRADVVSLTQKVMEVMTPQEPPTFFEFVTVMAFCYFAMEKVDLAVMETGMGGRLDATNVIQPLVGVITNISVEHTDYLGRTLMEIAGEKAGIIKPGLSVVTGEKRKRLREFFSRTTRERGGRLLILGRDFRARSRPGHGFDYYGLKRRLPGLKLKLMGQHQVRNTALALAALELLAEKGFVFTEEDIRLGLASVSWPGRGEVFPGSPDLMLDGAHNPAAAATLAKLLRRLDYKRLHLVLGIMADKNIPRIMAPLLPHAHALYLTRPEYHRAASPEVLAAAAKGFTGQLAVLPTISEAIEAAKSAAAPTDLVLVTGSLFTVGEARAFLTGEEDI
ncbi:MAG: bifunctional folylpolyglutamate synthase/dihydrofolate synthase [Deltaproteobacteria bacterium]|nr:bifunctional folylpolyglutamate synthase/dihydrofolate synthase [Deltaproteobacteria bacterium]MBW2084898.1 bifunctional folylpolyglutamate synthase/dihydrofolate synthase [Deltaproteobacteria bacterium]